MSFVMRSALLCKIAVGLAEQRFEPVGTVVVPSIAPSSTFQNGGVEEVGDYSYGESRVREARRSRPLFTRFVTQGPWPEKFDQIRR